MEMVLGNWEEPEAEYSALDCGVLEEVMKELCAQGKLKISSVSDGTTYYMLVEDAAVEEEPDEVVPGPEEEEEEEEEEEVQEVVVPRDRKLSVAAAKMWVRAADSRGVLQVDASRCISRYLPKKGFPLTVKRVASSTAVVRGLFANGPLVRILKAVETALAPFKIERALTDDDFLRSNGASIIYLTVGLDGDGSIRAAYTGQKTVNFLRRYCGNYGGSFRFLVARQKLLDAPLLVVMPMAIVEGGITASRAEAVSFGSMFGEARALDLVDDIIVQGPPIGAPAKLLSAPVERAIRRLPADHALRRMLRELEKDPNYAVQLSAPTKAARSAAAKEGWDRKPAAKKKKVVEICVEIKIQAPHAIDATLKNLTHWFISTQVKHLKKVGNNGKRWDRKTAKEKQAYADRQSKAQGGNGSLSPQQHRQLVKLVKVNSRRDFSCIFEVSSGRACSHAIDATGV